MNMLMRVFDWVLVFLKSVAFGRVADRSMSARSFAKIEAAAKSGDPSAQFELGNLYAEGVVVDKDYFQAAGWFRSAAEQEHAPSQHNLGAMYFNGEGVKQDVVEAKRWYGKACENKFQKGCDNYRKLNEAGY